LSLTPKNPHATADLWEVIPFGGTGGCVKVSLVSKDRKLYKFCQEILPGLSGGHSLLDRRDHYEAQSFESDVFIWDFQPGMEIPVRIVGNNLRKHIFVVHSRDMIEFREKVPFDAASLLLKPVSPSALSAFIGQAIPCDLPDATDHVGLLRADRDEMLHRLIQSNLKLQEYDHERTNFLSRAVHDFRAPLTAITGYCGLMLEEQLGTLSEDQKEVLERMQHSVKRLSRMANAMFQLSIGRQIEVRPNLQKNDIRECIDQALHEMLPFTNEKNITVSVDVTVPPDELYFEMSQLEQVIINLLDNASKFTPKGGFIRIKGYPFFWDRRSNGSNVWRDLDRRLGNREEPNVFRIDIQDSGPGIPVPDLNGIFEEYTSYSGSQDRSGGGLGLAICKLIMTQHQGGIWAGNLIPRGAVFSFVVPLHGIETRVPVDSSRLQAVSSRTGGL
jgi:signal transduction histidine kinase